MNTQRPPIRCSCGVPRTLVIPVGLAVSSLVEKLPRVQITRGWISSTCFSRYGRQESISSGWGSRFPGGRHLRTFAMKTSSRFSPIPSSRSVRKAPARPTNGRPWRSSSAPGASPDEHQVGIGIAGPEDHPVSRLRQRAALADRGPVVDLDERLAARLGVAHEPCRRRAADRSAARCRLKRSLAPPRSTPRLLSRRRFWLGVICRCSGA